MFTTGKSGFFRVAICALIVAAAAAIRADTTGITADDIFRTDGLVRDGKWLVLQSEGDLHNRVWALQQSDEAVRSATSTHRSLQPELIQGQNTIETIADQRASLLKTIDGFKGKTDNDSIDAMNRTITQSDQLWSKLVREREMLDGLSQRESQVEEARARFIGGIMDAQAKADAIGHAYSHLAQNDVLSAAIAQANANADQPLTLGPSPQFTEDQQFLHDSAQRIVSAWVAVQKANTIGGLHVLPIINGKLTVSMTWDSGCSDTQLSRDTAAALGLDLNDKSPSIEITIANGATIKAKKAVLDSVQLGPFTLHSVECVVMEGSDLLGNSFQSHFLSRLDQQSGKLQLTPIDSSVDIGAIGEPVFASEQNSQKNSETSAYHPPARPKDFDLARLATATASSTMDGSTPRGAIDGIVAGAPDNPRNEWACDQPTGSITLTWDQPVSISSAKMWDRPDGSDHIVSGQMVFDDGSTVPFGELPTDGTSLALHFASHTVKWIRFEILSVGAGTQHPGFAEICLFQ